MQDSPLHVVLVLLLRVIAGFKLGKLDEEVEVHLPGGELLIIVYKIGEEVRIFMEGEAVLVFDGVMELDI